jgi:SAM-dependent methyltransferase
VVVQVEAETLVLEKLFERVEMSWQQLGNSEPYWSVLAAPKFKADRIEAAKADFYGSGAADRDLFLAAADRCHVELPRKGTCYELGCGVGRVTLWLAQSFHHIIAVDISAFHLALAQRAVQQSGRSNIELRLLTTPRSIAESPAFESFFSFIVLQHNPPPVMRWLLRESLFRLKPGGLGFFQLPTSGYGYHFDAADYLAKPSHELMEMHVLPQTAVLSVLEETGCYLLEAREHDCIGHPAWISKTFLVRKALS